MDFRTFQQNLLERVRQAGLSHAEILRSVGYPNATEEELSRLDEMLNDLYLGTTVGYFNYDISAKDLLIRVGSLVGIDAQVIADHVNEVQGYCGTYNKSFRPFVFADTDFVRKSESIWLLGLMSGQRYWRLSETREASLREQIEEARAITLRFMKSTGGELKIFGTIKRFAFYYLSEEHLVFDLEGNIISPVNKFRALDEVTLTAKGRPFTLCATGP